MKAPHFNHSKKKRGFILGYVTYNINLGTETTVIRTNVTTVVASKVTVSPFKGLYGISFQLIRLLLLF